MSSPAVFIFILLEWRFSFLLYSCTTFFYLCNLSKINADLAPLGSQRAFLNSRKGVPPRLRVQRYGNFPNWPNLFATFFNLFAFLLFFGVFREAGKAILGRNGMYNAPTYMQEEAASSPIPRGRESHQGYIIYLYTRARGTTTRRSKQTERHLIP